MSSEKTFSITVDGEKIEIPRKGVTPRKILEVAGLDPSQRFLIEKRGQKSLSYRDKLDEEIKVHENQLFLTGQIGPVPVS